MLVRITKAGDSPYKVGDEIELELFEDIVIRILRDGGEMPIAVRVPE